MRWPDLTLWERLMDKTVQSPTGCWLWTASKLHNGYGQIYVDGKNKLAHRVSYELCVDEIADGLTIDHLCRVRSCVNPDHMEPVSIGVNSRRGNSANGVNARKTHCDYGHLLSKDNTYVWNDWRNCRTCMRRRRDAMRLWLREYNTAYMRKYRMKKKQGLVE